MNILLFLAHRNFDIFKFLSLAFDNNYFVIDKCICDLINKLFLLQKKKKSLPT